MKHLIQTALTIGALLFASAAIAQDKTKVEIGYMPILPDAQLFVSLENGWISDAGIAPKLVQFQNGPAMVQALLAGQLDVAYFGIGPAMVARARGADIKVVASNIVEQLSFVALDGLAPYFKGDHKTAFARFAADNGRKAVITTFPRGSVPETVLQYWLRRQLGINPNEVKIIFQGAAQVQQALMTGAVDGALTLEPLVSSILARRGDAVVVSSGAALFPKQPGAVLAVRAKLIAAHPELVKKLVAAQIRATKLLKSDPASAAPAVGKYVGGGRLPAAIVLEAIKRSGPGFMADPNFIVSGTRVMRDFQKQLGTLKAPVDLNALFDLTFYDELQGR